MSKLFKFPTNKFKHIRACWEMLKIQHSDWFHCVNFSLSRVCSPVSPVISLRYEFMADFAGFLRFVSCIEGLRGRRSLTRIQNTIPRKCPGRWEMRLEIQIDGEMFWRLLHATQPFSPASTRDATRSNMCKALKIIRKEFQGLSSHTLHVRRDDHRRLRSKRCSSNSTRLPP